MVEPIDEDDETWKLISELIPCNSGPTCTLQPEREYFANITDLTDGSKQNCQIPGKILCQMCWSPYYKFKVIAILLSTEEMMARITEDHC